MHRFFAPPEALEGQELTLRGDQARQIWGVLKLRPGETIAVFDDSGAEYRVELTVVRGDLARGRVLGVRSDEREPRTRLVLYQGLLKHDKFEWVLQKGTELGVAAFVPLRTERVVAAEVSRARRTRWERILVEAAEQAGRTRLPRLGQVQTLEQGLAAAQAGGGCALIPWEEERELGLSQALCPQGPVHLFIGPEGGLAPGEIEAARARGVRPITLGPRILRAETAGLAAASAILFARGDMDPRPVE